MPIQPYGGAAFPRPAVIHPDSARVLINGQDGMSLRDYFAGQWLAGIAASGVGQTLEARAIAQECYHIADELLKIRGG